LEAWLILLIAVHSYAVGFFLLFLTRWGARFGGWPEVEPLFFARQAGIFHLVVATGYLIEYVRYRGVAFLLTAKTAAVLFLTGVMLLDGAPWAVPLSAVGDAAMGLVVLLVRRKAAG
jgi:hypothetical protein